MANFRLHITWVLFFGIHSLVFASHIESENVTRCVVIGISDYQDEDIPDLQFAHRDAEAFTNYLLQSNGEKINKEHLTLLTNQDATGGKVHKALNELIDLSQSNDKVIIYFAGHGDVETSDGIEGGHLLLYDTPSHSYQINSLRVNDLKNIVTKLAKEIGADVTLITDACRSGTLAGSAVEGTQLTNNVLAQQFADETKILSCQADEFSLEGSQWGGGRGVFSLHLVEGLTGLADKNGDSQVTLRELQRYLEDKVEEAVVPNHQSPEVLGASRKVVSIVNQEALIELIEAKAEGSSYEEFTEVLEQSMELIDPKFAEFKDEFYSSLQQGYFISEDNADGYFDDLKSATEVYQMMRDNKVSDQILKGLRADLIAALQDDAQAAINSYLMSKNDEILYNWSGVEYTNYPLYLQKAADLLGPQHYLYNQMLAKKFYFEALNLRITANKAEDKLANYRLGEEKIKQALLYESHGAYIYNELGLAYWYQDKEGALEMYKRATELSPNWAVPFLNIADFYFNSGDVDKAEQYINISMQKDPSFFKSTHLLSDVLMSKEEFGKAESILLSYMENYGATPSLYFGLGEYYYKTGNIDEAIINFKLAIGSEDDYASFVYLGNCYYNLDASQAKFYWEKAMSISPNEFAIVNNLAWLYQGEKDFPKAIELYEKAIKLNSKLLNARLNLGKIYFQSREFDKSELHFNYILEDIDAEHVESHYFLARLLAIQGKLDIALSHLSIALDSGFKPVLPLNEDDSFSNLQDSEAFQKMLKGDFKH